MTRSPLTRLARALAGALLALVGVLLSSGGSVQAGCVKPHDSASHFEHLIRAGAMPASTETVPPGKPPTCSGPMCSRGPASPPSSSWTTLSGPEFWAVLTERLRPEAAFASRIHPDSNPTMPSDRAPSIFHPPRCSSV